MNPYRLPRLAVLIPAALCPVVALALLFGERVDIVGVQLSDHPLLFAGGVVGTIVSWPLYRWLYRKDDRWELADVPGWEEEIQAEADESARTQPIDMWGRIWPAFWAVMLPPVGVIVGIRAVRKATTTDRTWTIGSLAVASILTALSVIAILQT